MLKTSANFYDVFLLLLIITCPVGKVFRYKLLTPWLGEEE